MALNIHMYPAYVTNKIELESQTQIDSFESLPAREQIIDP